MRIPIIRTTLRCVKSNTIALKRPATTSPFHNHNNTIFTRSFHASKITSIDFDPYKTLGVEKSADDKQIKKAYYDLVKKYHPDVNKEKDAETRFHKIQESYELLRDKQKRAQYDQFGAAAFDANGNANPFAGGGGNPFGGHGGNPFGGSAQGHPFSGMGFDFEDLEAFAGGRGSTGGGAGGRTFVTEHVGDNIEVLKSIPFKESIFGTTVTINYKAVDSCTSCSGSGLKAGAKKNTCPTCHGTGQTTHIMGGFHMSSTCPTCQGAGVTINKQDECGTCHGHGVQEIPKSRTVEIPPGVNDGTRIRIPGAGDAPMVTKDPYNKVVNGDLIVRISVKKDPVFTRNRNDLIVNQEILMTTAALGGEIVVPTIDGQQIKLKIRPGAQNGRKLTIPEKGVPINRNTNNRGNLEVILNVKVLVPETPTQKALLEALADTFNDKNARRTDADWSLDIEDNKDGKINETYDESDLHPSKLKRIGKVLGKFFNLEQTDKDEKK
ncbi:LOW QUALITY PROTEIN: MDJ1 DnaJ 1 [Candida maltosa Xu316]